MLQTSLFDLTQRHQKLNERDPLVMLNELIDWEHFRETLQLVREKQGKNKAGRKPFDVVLMFKALILKYVQVHQSSRKFLFHLFHRFLPTHPSDTS